ncbi:FAD-binding oxidoreductase [Pinibacter aurantiacus]|uniref:Flavodoxin reductase n=1 Tax=Pinibacter aurantiacus TaxID=2851599 RepID=A0A9E2SBX0_9BACT|nr:FAD-binding oxidoreductase [Pinibacter aurantiacus]MBV4358659.1 flavodoxin reductase [Pinibacter aurantiacus]
MEIVTKIIDIIEVARNVKSFRLEKPKDYDFVPGQATELSINKEDWKEEKRPFTFTALEEQPYLEFTIKRYPDHRGVTDQIHQLKVGDEVILRDVWGTIQYNGPGYFIAGGAGITPFIAILRRLHKDNKIKGNTLFFSNNEQVDIIYESEFRDMLGENAVFILTKENKPGYLKDYINKDFLQKHVDDFKKHFYICGPDAMVKDIIDTLNELGAPTETVVFEK